jgi:hypothetical protein
MATIQYGRQFCDRISLCEACGSLGGHKTVSEKRTKYAHYTRRTRIELRNACKPPDYR